jgi:hypothetical protein
MRTIETPVVLTGRLADPASPAVRLTIVGVVRSLWYGDDVGGRDIAILRALG